VNNTLKVSDEVIQALRVRKANFGDKSMDETLRHALGIGHSPTVLNPKPSTPEQMNPIRNHRGEL